MARIGFHPHPLTAAHRAARRVVKTIRYAEKTCERHWPLAAYAVLTLATMTYIVAQLAPII